MTAGTDAEDRSAFLDALRALAISCVVVHAVVGLPWPVVVAAVGVLFAVSGSLMARSLDAEGRHYAFVLRRRLLRLLAVVWAFGAIAVPVMFSRGWTTTVLADSEQPGPSGASLLLWAVPLATPPANEQDAELITPLWFVATVLWLVVLSPALLWLARRWRKRMLAAPVVLLALASVGLLSLQGVPGGVLLSVLTYAGCWLVGFAHHDGVLARQPGWRVGLLGVGLVAAGVLPAGADLVGVDPSGAAGAGPEQAGLAAGLYAMGAVLLAFRLPVSTARTPALPVMGTVTRMVAASYLTLYVWAGAAVAAAWRAVEWEPLATAADYSGWPLEVIVFGTTVAVLAVVVGVLGGLRRIAGAIRERYFPRARRAQRVASRREPAPSAHRPRRAVS